MAFHVGMQFSTKKILRKMQPSEKYFSNMKLIVSRNSIGLLNNFAYQF